MTRELDGWFDYCLCEPAIVLAALVRTGPGGKPELVTNGVWYSYVVLPAQEQKP